MESHDLGRQQRPRNWRNWALGIAVILAIIFVAENSQRVSVTFLFVKNGDSAQHTVTIHTTATIYGQPISNIAVPVPAGQEMMLGPYDPAEVAARSFRTVVDAARQAGVPLEHRGAAVGAP